MKKITLKNQAEIDEYIEILNDAANSAQMNILELSEYSEGMQLLEEIKFEKIGYDPLNVERSLNYIEQVNQTFTYLASFKAVEILLRLHPEACEFVLNLATAAGTDNESKDEGGIAAEVFAATSPSNNNKLNKDFEKVSKTNAANKYVFFLCPSIEAGMYHSKSTNEVTVWSIGN
jgi:predicted O-linked N-acetylglucosamine transferase (SPINDLY family)